MNSIKDVACNDDDYVWNWLKIDDCNCDQVIEKFKVLNKYLENVQVDYRVKYLNESIEVIVNKPFFFGTIIKSLVRDTEISIIK
jgi:hypothetical protein